MKNWIIIGLLLLGGMNLIAKEKFNMTFGCGYVDPTEVGHGPNRTPPACPNVSLESHTLSFINLTYDVTLVLVDEEGDAVCSMIVPAGTPVVSLPLSLVGNFELQIYPEGNFYFFCDITL